MFVKGELTAAFAFHEKEINYNSSSSSSIAYLGEKRTNCKCPFAIVHAYIKIVLYANYGNNRSFFTESMILWFA